MDSGHYYCIIECARAQFWYNNVIKRKIEPEVAGISKKKRSREREKIYSTSSQSLTAKVLHYCKIERKSTILV